MSPRILGIGLGLFLLLLLWSIALITLLVTRRANNGSIRSVGLLAILTASIITLMLLVIPRVSINHHSEPLDQYTNFWHLQITRHVTPQQTSQQPLNPPNSKLPASSITSSSLDLHDVNSDHNLREPDLPPNGLHLLRWMLFGFTLLSVIGVTIVLFVLVIKSDIQRPKMSEMIRSARIYSTDKAEVASNTK